MTPKEFYALCIIDKPKAIEYLNNTIDDLSALVNYRSVHDVSLLHIYASVNDYDMIRKLLKCGATLTPNYSGMSPFDIACAEGSSESVDVFIEFHQSNHTKIFKNKDLQGIINIEKSAPFQAIRNNYPQIVKRILPIYLSTVSVNPAGRSMVTKICNSAIELSMKVGNREILENVICELKNADRILGIDIPYILTHGLNCSVDVMRKDHLINNILLRHGAFTISSTGSADFFSAGYICRATGNWKDLIPVLKPEQLRDTLLSIFSRTYEVFYENISLDLFFTKWFLSMKEAIRYHSVIISKTLIALLMAVISSENNAKIQDYFILSRKVQNKIFDESLLFWCIQNYICNRDNSELWKIYDMLVILGGYNRDTFNTGNISNRGTYIRQTPYKYFRNITNGKYTMPDPVHVRYSLFEMIYLKLELMEYVEHIENSYYREVM